MKITIIGSGYVGLVSAACFAQMGNRVTCFDIDKEKIASLCKGEIPIYEIGLKEMIEENLNRTLFFTADAKEAYSQAQIIFIAVGTPMGEEGQANLSYVLNAAKDIGNQINSYCVIVNKSTAPVGTLKRIKQTIKTQLNLRGLEIDFDTLSNPEFLKEGVAIKDFMSPDRIIIGSDSKKAIALLQELYSSFTLKKDRFIIMDAESAEMTKYAANAMLATKISFINEMSRICEAVGADINSVRIGIGSDPRIGYDFIYPGIGYGGSCFPKDIRALQKTAETFGVDAQILKAIESSNEIQKHHLINKITQRFGEDLRGRKFAIWGLSFKPQTDDVRESPSLTIIQGLQKRGAGFQVYDPKAMDNARPYLKNIEDLKYCKDKYLALEECDALLILTEWKEFRSPDFSIIKEKLKGKFIFDGRNIYTHCNLLGYGLEYICIGKKYANF